MTQYRTSSRHYAEPEGRVIFDHRHISHERICDGVVQASRAGQNGRAWLAAARIASPSRTIPAS